MNYLSTDLNINDIDVVHSLMGGMLALKKKNYKMVLLDMILMGRMKR